ncbi:MAG: YbdK family carboxylate-amine ligase [Thermoleophilia bacterium]|nr:YbdK family carboxylate-amine ligase [Thermoleophilia bacterium]
MIPHAFGRSRPGTVGIEEELFVLDAETLVPASAPESLFRPPRLKRELFAAVVELTTTAAESVHEAGEELRALRGGARRRAAEAGLALAAAATWPPAAAEEQEVTADAGYLKFVEYAGSAARRQFCSGLHVHVAVGSPEACMRTLEGLLPWLPVLLAVSANSPFLGGRATGLASNRAELLSLLPRSGAPPVFTSYGEWERFAERLVQLGLADEVTRIWWDVRPHPRFGTLEVRMPDQPTRVEVTLAFAALVQALVLSVRPGRAGDRGLYAQNRWAAARFGGAAELVHPDGERLASVRELFAELVERVRPVADGLGTTRLLGPLTGLAQAEEQLAIARRDGLRRLCEHLVAAT